MNAPPFPLNPSVGERNGMWVWNGARWVCSPTTGIAVVTTVFTGSGPYMPSPGLVSVVVECLGGGGGGGGCFASVSTQGGAGGGGSGGYSRKTLPAALVAGGVQVTIGAGGTGGPGDVGTGKGTDGGVTSFGALCVAGGGQGGEGMDFNQHWGDPGNGANIAGGVGDMVFPGNPAGPGYAVALLTGSIPVFQNVWGGHGGCPPSLGGGGGISLLASTGIGIPGDTARGPGAGGAGGCANITTTWSPGGNGGPGLCVVTEYCWASADDGGECVNPPINVNARVAVTHVPWTGPGPCPPGWGGQIDYDGGE